MKPPPNLLIHLLKVCSTYFLAPIAALFCQQVALAVGSSEDTPVPRAPSANKSAAVSKEDGAVTGAGASSKATAEAVHRLRYPVTQLRLEYAPNVARLRSLPA